MNLNLLRLRNLIASYILLLLSSLSYSQPKLITVSKSIIFRNDMVKGSTKELKATSKVSIGEYNRAGHFRPIYFQGDKWRAFYRLYIVKEVPLPKKVSCRVVYQSDFSAEGYSALQIIFLDKQLKPIKMHSKAAVIKATGNRWVTAVVDVKVPEQAVSRVRCQIIKTSGSGTIKIGSIALYKAVDMDAASAAAAGYQSTEDTVIPGRENENLPKNILKIQYIKNVEFKIFSPQWHNVTSYALPDTYGRKAALENCAASFKLLCDDKALYVRLAATDNQIYLADNVIYKNDCFEFFFSAVGYKKRNGKIAWHPEMGVQIQLSLDKVGKTLRTGGINNKKGLDIKSIIKKSGNKLLGVIRIPWKNKVWKITPFNGLRLKANVRYIDYDMINGDKRTQLLSYAKDPAKQSIYITDVYSTMQVVNSYAELYNPVEIKNRKTGAVNSISSIKPDYEGWFNLERGRFQDGFIDYSCFGNDAGIGRYQTTTVTHHGHAVLCLDGTELASKTAETDKNFGDAAIFGTAFDVKPGETLKISFYAKIDQGRKYINAQILSLQNWKWFTIKVKGDITGNGIITTQWQKFTGTAYIKPVFTGINRNVRISLGIRKLQGRKVYLSEREIIRMTAHPIDCKLSTVGMFSHFFENQAKSFNFSFYSKYKKKQKLTISVTIEDILKKKTIYKKTYKESIMPNMGNKMNIKLPVNKLGFFEVKAVIYDHKQNEIAGDSIYITIGKNPDGIISDYHGLWHHILKMPLHGRMPEVAEFIKKNGINKIELVNIPSMTFRPQGATKFDKILTDTIFNAFYNVGFKIAFVLQNYQYGATGIPEQNLELVYSRINRFLKPYSGKVDWVSYGSEANHYLKGYERAIELRVAYNAVKNASPSTQSLILAPITSAEMQRTFDIKYYEDYWKINKDYFGDAIIGCHMYNFQILQDTFPYRYKGRMRLEQLFPNHLMYDTESGLVMKTYRQLINSLSKKTASQLSVGVKRHYIYEMSQLFVPYSDSSPALPLIDFEVIMYHGAEPLGMVQLSDNVIGYLFKRKNGYFMTFWNMNPDKSVKVNLPCTGDNSKIYDMFGNVVMNCQPGSNRLVLKDDFVHYVTGIDKNIIVGLKSFSKSFYAAMKNKKEKVIVEKYITNPYLILQPYRGKFTVELVKDRISSFSCIVRNDGSRPAKFSILADGPPQLKIDVTTPDFILGANKQKEVIIKLLTLKTIKNGSFTIKGYADNKPMVPLPLAVKTENEIIIKGYSRILQVHNISDKHIATEILFDGKMTRNRFITVKPAVITRDFAKKLSVTIPVNISMSPKINIPKVKYQISVKTKNSLWHKYGTLFYAKAQNENNYSKADYKAFDYTLKPVILSKEGFKISFSVKKSSKYLRFTAKVTDQSPMNGDSLIIGLDLGKKNYGRIYGKEDFECGIILNKTGVNKVYRYNWKGQYGLESSKDFRAVVKKVRRSGKAILYDICIPMKAMKSTPSINNLKQIGFAVLVNNKTNDGSIETIRFGDGLAQMPRGISKFGILQLK